jgi:2-polyprenyl-3-methyl-5-hydroxy-6-metoxy-1,4-benzoquinol methylase
MVLDPFFGGTDISIELPQASSGSQLEAMKDDRCTPLQIRSRPNPCCYLCGSEGRILYEGLQDKLFQAPGDWNSKVCPNADCGLIWLDPIPVEEDINKAYAKYYTHAESAARESDLINILRKGVSRILTVVSLVHRERKRLSLMYLDEITPGRVLDVGCGDGFRLAQLRTLGWKVFGQDVDPQAVICARETFGLDVHLGPLEAAKFEEMHFDCILLNHVIEHVHDPVKLLGECRRLLRKGGHLVIVTPNSESFGHKHFGAFWRGLEPPRHIHIFSPKTLSVTAARAGLTISRSWTTVANATSIWHGSTMIRNSGRGASSWRDIFLSRARALGYQYRSLFEHVRDKDSGEECVLRATR